MPGCVSAPVEAEPVEAEPVARAAPRRRRLAVWIVVLLGLAALAVNSPPTRTEPLPWVGTLDI